jgi:hypothetical protein
MATTLGSVVSTTNVDPWTREGDRLAALGPIAHTGMIAGSGNPASQTVHGGGLYLYNGETVTNIVVFVQTAATGAAPTSLKLGLWSSAGTPVCLAVTAELNSDARWTSQGYKVNALTAALPITSSALYYPVFWINGAFGGTNVALSNHYGGSGVVGGAISGFKQWGGSIKAGTATMAVNDTGTYGNAASFWFAVT